MVRRQRKKKKQWGEAAGNRTIMALTLRIPHKVSISSRVWERLWKEAYNIDSTRSLRSMVLCYLDERNRYQNVGRETEMKYLCAEFFLVYTISKYPNWNRIHWNVFGLKLFDACPEVLKVEEHLCPLFLNSSSLLGLPHTLYSLN